MNQPMSLDRLVAEWMADNAPTAPTDDLVDQILTATARQRPRPRWLALLQEPPMQAQTRVLVGSPTRRLAFAAILLLVAALAATAVGALLLQQPKPTASDDWPGFRGDASHVGLAARGPIGNPVVTWTTSLNAPIQHAVAIMGDLAYVPSDDGVLTALGVTDGTTKWSFSATAPMRAPFATDGVVHVVDGDGVVHALKAADGAPLWASTTKIPQANDGVVTGGLVYYTSPDGAVVALDATTGAHAWRTAVSPTPIGMSPPTVADGLVAAVDIHGFMTALDARSGAVRWAKQLPIATPGTPVIANGSVYIGVNADATSGKLVALSASDGSERWSIDQALFSPSIFGSIGYSASPLGPLTAIDLSNGKALWSARLPAAPMRAPAVTDSYVYVYTEDNHRLVTLDRATGGQVWTFDLDDSNQCCVAVSKGMLFVATSSGTVYAIGGDNANVAVGPIPNVAAPSAIAPTTAPTTVPIADLKTSIDWVATSGAADFAPWGLAKAPDGKLWAAEGLSHRFAIFSADGKFLETWGSAGSGEGQFNLRRANGDPYGMVAFAPDGSFFVLDVGNHRVQAFDKDRKFKQQWGSLGKGPSQFTEPVGMAVDADGNVVVVDNVRAVIETFRPDGTIVSTIPEFPRELGATAGVNRGVNQIHIGPNGHFFLSVVDPNLVVAEVDTDGKLIRTIAGSGEPGALSEQPNGVAFDADGRMYLNQGPGRGDAPGVLVFAPDGTYLGGFGHSGAGDADLGFPWGIIVDESGIYVSDPSGISDFGLRSAIRKFAPIAFSN